MFVIRSLGALALAATLTVPLAASAQTPPPLPGAGVSGAPGPHHRHHNRLREALRGLTLNASQQQQIDQIFATFRAQNRNADKATRHANRKQLRSQIEAVLTPAQREQLEAQLRRGHRSR